MVKKKKKERFGSHEETNKKALIRVAVELKIVVRHVGNVKYTYKMQLIYRITLRIQRILKCSVIS